MKRTIRIKFVDFWGDFDEENNFITEILSQFYELEFSDKPDYLFFSTFGFSNLYYECVKIMFVGENIVPDFNICDYALGFDHLQFGERYFRLPLYQTYESFVRLEEKTDLNEEQVLGRKFCCVVVSNSRYASPHRERFYRLLSEYKQVDSGGKLWNNVGGPVVDKLSFVSQYKFNIAFENSSVQGYTTEKIMEPMVVNTLPIYWGNPLVGHDFNPDSFINVNDFSSLEEAVQYVVDIDQNDDKYMAIIKQPWITNSEVLSWRCRLSTFLSNIIDKNIIDAKFLSEYGYQKLYRQEKRVSHLICDKMKVKRIVTLCDTIRKRFEL